MRLLRAASAQTTAAKADFDGNGVVDIPDFLQFVNAFGSTTGQAAYNAKFDLNGNGAVDIPDFLQFVNVFGQTVQVVDSIEGDRAALIALYNATDGDKWAYNWYWKSDKPLGEWYGVTTNEQGRVIGLYLRGTRLLYGTLPSSIGNLTKLERLGLISENLTGIIPSSIGNLTNLKELRLYFGGNQSPVPFPASIRKLTNLTLLELLETRLSGHLPEWIGNLSNLESLDLGENQLTGPIPESIGKLSKLKVLRLSGNQLTGPIPASIGNLANLEQLLLATTALQGPLPLSLLKLTNLSNIYLARSPNLCLPSDPNMQKWAYNNNINLKRCE